MSAPTCPAWPSRQPLTSAVADSALVAPLTSMPVMLLEIGPGRTLSPTARQQGHCLFFQLPPASPWLPGVSPAMCDRILWVNTSRLEFPQPSQPWPTGDASVETPPRCTHQDPTPTSSWLCFVMRSSHPTTTTLYCQLPSPPWRSLGMTVKWRALF